MKFENPLEQPSSPESIKSVIGGVAERIFDDEELRKKAIETARRLKESK